MNESEGVWNIPLTLQLVISFKIHISPSLTQKIVKKIKHALWDVAVGDTVDLNTLDAHLTAGGFDPDDDSDGEGDGDEENFTDFDVTDSVGKTLALMKQVSPQFPDQLTI